MYDTKCKITIKDGSKKLTTDYELLGCALTIDKDDPNIQRMLNETIEQFKIEPDAQAPDIVIKTTTVIQ